MIHAVEAAIHMLLTSNDYRDVWVAACGNSFKRLLDEINMVYPLKIVDKDPNLHLNQSYAVADIIFDRETIKPHMGDLLITLHGEKLYPPTRVYKDTDHILLIQDGKNTANCTKTEYLIPEQETMEHYQFDRFDLFYGCIDGRTL